MTEKINEMPLWDYLKTQQKPILLYGMGNGADMIIEVLSSLGITYADTFASDGFVRGQIFHGKKVLSFSEAKEKYSDFIILMTFGLHDEKSLDMIKNMNANYELYSPTVPLAGSGLFTFDFIKEHDSEFDKAFNLLADERSKKDFLNVLKFKISGKLSYLFESYFPKEKVYSEILSLDENEVIVDLGAYDGDTVREFLSATNNKYKKIFAFEPDEKNFRKLKAKTEQMNNIELHNLGAWDKEETLFFKKQKGRNSHLSPDGIPVSFNSVDNVIKEDITLLKMDIEGAELKALDGAKETIRRCKPKLYVCAYHRNEDYFALPLKIKELCPDYKIYFCQHPYVPAWEGNFYAKVKR